MIATASHSRSTSSSWWRGEDHRRHRSRRSREHAAQDVDAGRVEPARTARPAPAARARGPARRRAAPAAGCPATAPRRDRSARSARPRRSIQRVGAARVAAHAVQRGEVGELVAARASSDRARAPPACSRSAGGAASMARRCQRTSPAVGREHAEDDPHRRRLAGPVGADEAEHLARRDGEADTVERDPVAVAPGQPVEFEAVYPTSAGSSRPWSRSRPRWTAAMNFERLTSSVLRISSA